MRYIKDNLFLDYISNIISEKHQIKGSEFHLTVSKVFEIQGRGAIDFGGSEEKKAKIAQLEPVKRNPEDKYGWWELDSGMYIININEKIKLEDNQIGIIAPLPRTIKAGANISTKVITNQEESDINLTLFSMKGINIKENARIAKLSIIQI